MDGKEKKKEENYEYIYEDYFEEKNGDAEDMIFAVLDREKKHSEK